MDYRRLTPIIATVFTNLLGAGVILPILPLYAEGEFKATAFLATLLGAVYFAAQFVAAPWLGRLSDRVGRRPVLIVSQLGTVLSFVLFIFAGPIGQVLDEWGFSFGITGGLFMLFVARMLDGVTGGNITTARAYVADISTEENRAQSLGLISASFGLGFIFGPVMGGLLANISLVAPFVGAAVITLGSVLLTYFLLDESLPPEKRVGQGDRSGEVSRPGEIPFIVILRNNTVSLIMLLMLSLTLAFSAVQATFSLFAERVLYDGLAIEVVARNVGLALAGAGGALVFVQVFVLKVLVRRVGEQWVVLLGQLCLYFGLLGIGLSENGVLGAFFLAFVAMGQGFTQPSLQSLVTRFGDGQSQGQLLGLLQSFNSLGLIVGPVWAGLVFQFVSPRATYVVGASLMVPAVFLAVMLLWRPIPTRRRVA